MATTPLAALLLLSSAGIAARPPDPVHPRAWRPSLEALAREEPEAARVASWVHRLDPELLALSREPGCEAVVLAVHGARPLPIPPQLAHAIAAFSAYHTAVDRSLQRPVPAERLAAALRAPATAPALRATFERAHAGATVHDRSTRSDLAFEPGGIAWLLEAEDGRSPPGLCLQEVDDPIHAFARQALALRARPIELATLLRRDPIAAMVFDPDGLLRAALARNPPMEPYPERARRGLDLALDTLGANVADSWGLDETTLARALAASPPPPGALYLGRWHGHPGRRGGEPPSEDDRRVARIQGRFLTVVERPDGVDVYDVRREQVEPEPLRLRW